MLGSTDRRTERVGAQVESEFDGFMVKKENWSDAVDFIINQRLFRSSSRIE